MSPPGSRNPSVCPEHRELVQAVFGVRSQQLAQGEVLRRVEGYVKDVHNTVKTLDGRLIDTLRENGNLGARVSNVEGRLDGMPASKQVANLAGRFDEGRAVGARTAVWVIAVVGWVIAVGGILWKVL